MFCFLNLVCSDIILFSELGLRKLKDIILLSVRFVQIHWSILIFIFAIRFLWGIYYLADDMLAGKSWKHGIGSLLSD